MPVQRSPRDAAAHVIKLHGRGIICPSLMWSNLADALTPDTALAVLDDLPAEARNHLFVVFRDRPPAAYLNPSSTILDPQSLRTVCATVVSWCAANAPPLPLPFKPDGLIRVKVEAGRVVEHLLPGETGQEPFRS